MFDGVVVLKIHPKHSRRQIGPQLALVAHIVGGPGSK
jgi:hypothetical protein